MIDAAGHVVGDVDAARNGCDAGRSLKAGKAVLRPSEIKERVSVFIEYVDAAVSVVGHVDVSVFVFGEILRADALTDAASLRADIFNKFSVGVQKRKPVARAFADEHIAALKRNHVERPIESVDRSFGATHDGAVDVYLQEFVGTVSDDPQSAVGKRKRRNGFAEHEDISVHAGKASRFRIARVFSVGIARHAPLTHDFDPVLHENAAVPVFVGSLPRCERFTFKTASIISFTEPVEYQIVVAFV